MFMSPGFAVVFIILELIAGSVIGFVVAALVFWRRFTLGVALMAPVLGGLAVLVASGVVGWADSHAAFYNGRRLDLAPWGENLWLRNRIAEHGLLLCLVSTCTAALIAGLIWGRKDGADKPS
jgi:hypothetical protein